MFRVRTANPVPAPAGDVLAGIERDDRTPRHLRSEPQPRRALEVPETSLPSRSSWNQERTLDLEGSKPTKGPPPRLETAPFRPADVEVPATALAPQPSPAATTGRDERARRLARVLVSDILVYNQGARDRALGEGNLAVALAAEITKAWDLYKSKVGAETASGSTYFKDALNEILADGTKVF